MGKYFRDIGLSYNIKITKGLKIKEMILILNVFIMLLKTEKIQVNQ